MYMQTAENLESERLADQHYEKSLIARFHVLEVDGGWRGKVREIHAMEAKADEYREIKTQEVARDALRTDTKSSNSNKADGNTSQRILRSAFKETCSGVSACMEGEGC